MTYVVAMPCVDILDRSCIQECPVDCIYEGERMMYIHPDECIDCGACESACPQEAIFYEEDVPEKWSAFTQSATDFCADLGSPGGSESVGRIGTDTPMVAALPRDD
ncbi:ferredoxin [Sciscionella marina]|uniref:ferredoxin n=1 Tax=Sciscionella marina TaxID=508770 RepID=UPI00036EB188|nr:ferredoxin [Sciscionella marina]